MTTPLRVTVSHQLGLAEARRRIDTRFAKLANQLPGGVKVDSQRWDGDRLLFGVSALGQTLSGRVDVLENIVTIDIELPGLLGPIAGLFQHRLQTAGRLLLTRR